jgi:hypothetical protein
MAQAADAQYGHGIAGLGTTSFECVEGGNSGT